MDERFFPEESFPYPCPLKGTCGIPCCTQQKIAMEESVFENGDESCQRGYCYQLHPPEPFLIPADEVRETLEEAAKAEARVSALFEEGRRQGAENVSRLLGPDGKIHAIVDGVSADGEAVLFRIVNTKKPERDYFSDPNLSRLFGTHVNTIANWRKGSVKPPEGFSEAFEKRDYRAMCACAEKYRANQECADAMNTKGVEHGISEEQMHRQRLK